MKAFYSKTGFDSSPSTSGFSYLLRIGVLSTLLIASTAQAMTTINTLPRFIEPQKWALGFEPAVAFSQNASLAGVGKFSYGLSDWNNLQLVFGNGTGDHQFRAGMQLTADIFPDYDGQPGIGIGGSVQYSRFTNLGQLELSVFPYIHKALNLSGTKEIEPYIAFPFGMNFRDGNYLPTSQLVVGAMFQNTKYFRYSFELGMAINNTDSFVSGGVTYYHDAP